MNNKKLSLLGRILFALPFGIIGLHHFFVIDFYMGLLTSFIPGGGFTIVLTGALLVAACISIIANRYVKLSCFLLAGMLLLFIITIHIPNLFDVAENARFAFMQLIKDTALMGGALIIAATNEPEKK
jgi:putative oxidoreductase